MALSYSEAVSRLSGVSSVEKLIEIIRNIDISADGNPTLLFSGKYSLDVAFSDLADDVALDGDPTRSIRKTAIAKFLDVKKNSELVDVLERLFGDDVDQIGTDANQFLNGEIGPDGKRIPNGIWDEISRRFARETVGDVRVLTNFDRPDGVFAQTELPELLANPNVTTIEGVPRQQLVDLVKANGPDGLDKARLVIAANSQLHIRISGLAPGLTAEYLLTGREHIETALKDGAGRAAVEGLLKHDDPDVRSAMRSAVTSMTSGAEASAISGWPRALNRLGYVGGLLSLLLVSSEAADAATPEEAEQIMKAWAVDAVGGEIGSIIGTAAAGVALAAFATVTAPVSIALVLGASVIGGFLGSDAAASFHAYLKDQDDASRRDILNRLNELYFGSGSQPTADTIPSQGSNFTFIDPELAPEAMVQAAQTSLAWRYALAKLNPFLVPEGPYQQLHNSNGELELFDPASGAGMTNEYLLARAESLHVKARMLNDDQEINAGYVFPPGFDVHYRNAESQFDQGDSGAELDLHYTSDFKMQRLFGGPGSDVLRGSTASDMLFGGAGNDVLEGKGGPDYLEGGLGNDTYFVGDGDRIFDRDGLGSVVFGNAILSGGIRQQGTLNYDSHDRKFRYKWVGSDLRVTRTTDDAMILIDDFTDRDLGIALSDAPPSVSVDSALQMIDGTAAFNILSGRHEDWSRTDPAYKDHDFTSWNVYNKADQIQGGGGSDWIYAWYAPALAVDGTSPGLAPDTDVVEGGGGKDFIFGGPGRDTLYATTKADFHAHAGTEATIDSGDLLSGQGDDDALYGSESLDGLFGGDGDDLIDAGGGNDLIAGDTSVYIVGSHDPVTGDYAWYTFDAQNRPVLTLPHGVFAEFSTGADIIFAGDGDDTVWGETDDDLVDGGSGNDRLFGDSMEVDVDGNRLVPIVFHGDDRLYGGAGNDQVYGNGGDDVLSGEAGDDWLDGDDPLLADEGSSPFGNDQLLGGDGDDSLIGNGGADVLLGGDGADMLYGDMETLPAYHHGSDVLFGGAGADILVGNGADDTLYGGDDNDILFGDGHTGSGFGGSDSLFGGAGDDELSGGWGADLLSGGVGNDNLWGDEGDDALSGGTGIDFLVGGTGADTYLFSIGDGMSEQGAIDTITDNAGEANRIGFSSDVDRQSFALLRPENGDDLVLRYSDTDSVYLYGGLTGTITTVSFAGAMDRPFHELIVESLPGARYLIGSDGNDLVFGSGDDDTLFGGGGSDDLHGGSGDDFIQAGDAADRLSGGAGDDHLEGGHGSDTYLFDSSHGRDAIQDSGGYDLVHFRELSHGDLDFSEQGSDLTMTHGADSVTVRDWRSGTVEAIRFSDYRMLGLSDVFDPDPLLGRWFTSLDAVNGTISGTVGDDEFDAASAGTRLQGGEGDDSYRLSALSQTLEIADNRGQSTLIFTGAPSAPVVFNVEGDDLVAVLDQQPVARIIDAANRHPYRVVLPNGESLTGDRVDDLINLKPVFEESIGVLDGIVGSRFSWFLPRDLVSDPEGGDLAFSISRTGSPSLPDWLNFDRVTGELSGMPRSADIGELRLNLLAEDEPGAQASMSFAIEIAPQDLEGITSQTIVGAVERVHFYDMQYAGDVDGDGYDDVLIMSELQHDSQRLSATTQVTRAGYLYFGEAGGWGETPARASLLYQHEPSDPASSHPGLNFSPYETPMMDMHGKVVLTALGDIDGDGYDDIGLTELDTGELVFNIIYGDSAGLTMDLQTAPLSSERMTRIVGLSTETPDAYVRIADIVDWDGDGAKDLMFQTSTQHYDLADPYYPDTVPNIGQSIHLFPDIGRFRGETVSFARLKQSGAFELRSDDGIIQSAKGIGDFDDDGYDDVLVTAWLKSGMLFPSFSSTIVYGGPHTTREIDLDLLASGESTSIEYGYGNTEVVHRLGDVNGDGIEDLLFATAADRNAVVLYGRKNRPEALDLAHSTREPGTLRINNNLYGPMLAGYDIASGDLSGDGIDDVVFGSFSVRTDEPSANHPGISGEVSGLSTIVFGQGSGFQGPVQTDALMEDAGLSFAVPYGISTSTASYDTGLPGSFLVAVADIDGDGISDLLKTAVDLTDGTGELSSVIYTVYGKSLANHSETTTIAAPRLIDSGGSHVAGDDTDTLVVQLGNWSGSVESGGGNDEIIIEPIVGNINQVTAAGRVEVSGGAGDDRITLAVPQGVSGVRLPEGGAHLFGGSGADTYAITASGSHSGSVFISDHSVPGGQNNLVLGHGYSAAGVRLGYGSLMLTFEQDGLEIHLENFDRENVLNGARDIDRFTFSDGVELSFEELVQLGFDVSGTAGSDHLEGTSVVDRLSGLGGDDVLVGGDGDDVLDGGSGNDLLRGGPGDDIYHADSSKDQILESNGMGFDRVISTGDFQLVANVEALTLVGDSAQKGTGNDIDNRLDGNDLKNKLYGGKGDDVLGGFDADDKLYGESGNDVLDGGQGRDKLIGGPGDDVYFVDNLKDKVTERPGEGWDTIFTSVDYELRPDIEELRMIGGGRASEGRGNNQANHLFGSDGNDSLWGLKGDDSLFGGDGDDRLIGGPGDDQLHGGGGDDSYFFAPGDGRDTIIAPDSTDGSDCLVFSRKISPDELWFSQSGEDLRIQLLGSSSDSVEVGEWFSERTVGLDQISLEQGAHIDAQGVAGLIEAMAGFAAPSGANLRLSSAQQEEYRDIAAAHWDA